jgi:hypothetical protein
MGRDAFDRNQNALPPADVPGSLPVGPMQISGPKADMRQVVPWSLIGVDRPPLRSEASIARLGFSGGTAGLFLYAGHREPLDAADVPRPSTCHAAARASTRRSAARPSTAGTVASGAGIKPGEPGEALKREPLDSGDVSRPRRAVPLRQDRCRWRDRPPGPRMPARWRAAPASSRASPARRSTAKREALDAVPLRRDRCRWRDQPRGPRHAVRCGKTDAGSALGREALDTGMMASGARTSRRRSRCCARKCRIAFKRRFCG